MEDLDFLYSDELRTLQQTGAVELHTAFSRGGVAATAQRDVQRAPLRVRRRAAHGSGRAHRAPARGHAAARPQRRGCRGQARRAHEGWAHPARDLALRDRPVEVPSGHSAWVAPHCPTAAATAAAATTAVAAAAAAAATATAVAAA